MGCCASRQSDEATSAVRAHSSSSRNNITAPSTQHSSVTSPRASHISQANNAPPPLLSPSPPASASRSRTDAIERPNTPLKPIQPTQRSRLPRTLAATTTKPSNRLKPLTDPTCVTWTRARLEKERQDWWDTQVTGSAEIWGAIRLATQHLQAGEVQEAQTMLDVTGCTCPTGLVWRGVFDATGVQYKVPEWVVVEPEGVVEQEEEGGRVEGVDGEGVGIGKGVGDGKEEEEEEEDEVVSVCIRTSHDSRDVMLQIHRKDSVARIVGKLREKAKLDSSAKIRLVYGGRVYNEHESLEAHAYWDFSNGFIVSGFVVVGI